MTIISINPNPFGLITCQDTTAPEKRLFGLAGAAKPGHMWAHWGVLNSVDLRPHLNAAFVCAVPLDTLGHSDVTLSTREFFSPRDSNLAKLG